jgi:hypothetical protein
LKTIPRLFIDNYRTNLAYLKKTDWVLYEKLRHAAFEPVFEITRDGLLTLKVKGRYLESGFEPEKHAVRLLPENIEKKHGTHFIFVGCGLGYHINAFLRKGDHRCSLIEESVDIFKAALHVLDPEFLPKVVLLVGLEPGAVLEISAQLNEDRIEVVRQPRSVTLGEKYYLFIERSLHRKLGERLATVVTERYMRRLWLKNILKNVRHAAGRFLGTRSLFRLFNGPVLLIASGPFLEDIVDPLRKLSKKMPLFALLPSVPYLLAHGIRPDCIVTTDAGFGNRFRFLKGIDIPLLSTFSIDACLANNWKGAVYMFSHGLPFENRLESLKRSCLPVPMQGTSAAVMILLARLMGFKALYLGGFDFCYRGMKDHHGGAGFDRYHLASSSRIQTWHTSVAQGIRKDTVVITHSQNGEKIRSSRKLLLYKEWIQNELASKDLFRLNEGARMKYLGYRPAQEINRTTGATKSSFLHTFERMKKGKIDDQQVYDDLRKINESIESLGDPEVQGWKEKLYGLFYGSVSEAESGQCIEADGFYAVDIFRKCIRSMESSGRAGM